MPPRRPEPPADRPGQEADPESVVRALVLRRLSSAPRTRAELEKDLAKRGADPVVAQQVLDRFEEVGLIDDRTYAQMWVESRHRTKALARSSLRRELIDRGVDRASVDEALVQIDDDSEWQRAREFAHRRVRLRAGEPPAKTMQRLAGQLARKGYPANMCFVVARETLGAIAEQGEHDVVHQVGTGVIIDDLPEDEQPVQDQRIG